MARSWRIPGLCVILSLLQPLNGCIVKMPSGATQKAIQDKQKTLVFARVKALVDGKPIDKPLIFLLHLARIDTGTAPTLAPRTSPTFTAFRGGWSYLVLEPGAYRLSFSVGSDERYAKKISDFWLDLPPGQSLVYAGTINLSCPKVGWFGDTSDCTSTEITQEPEEARAFGQAHFSEYGPMSTALLQPVQPSSLPPPPLQTTLPLGFLATVKKNLVSPNWVKRGVGRATGIGEDSEFGKSISGVGPVYPPEGAAGLFVLFLAYLAVGSAIGAAAGKAAEGKFQPCIQDLIKEMQNMDLERMLRRKMKEEVTKYCQLPPEFLESEADISQKAGNLGLKSVIQIDLQRIQIRECQDRGTFCLEVMARARLWDVAKNQVVRTVALVYTNVAPRRKVSYEVQVWKSSPCREMEAFCSPEGRRVFRDEIGTAFHYLVEKMLFEMGLLS